MRDEAAGFESAKASVHEPTGLEPHLEAEGLLESQRVLSLRHPQGGWPCRGPQLDVSGGGRGLGGHGEAQALAQELTELQPHLETEGLLGSQRFPSLMSGSDRTDVLSRSWEPGPLRSGLRSMYQRSVSNAGKGSP